MKATLCTGYALVLALLLLGSCRHNEPAPTPTSPPSGPPIVKSAAREILSFSFYTLTPSVAATVSAGAVTFQLPPGTDPTYLVPTIQVSNQARIRPKSGVAQDFSKPVAYWVKAENGDSTQYVVTMSRPAASAKDHPGPPQPLLVYYGWPSAVNGSGGNVATAAAFFSKFDLVVLGNGLANPSHGDYQKTKAIIAALRPGVKVFLYIDLGVSTSNLGTAQLRAAIDACRAMGSRVTGVFADDMGADYGVSRARQNDFIDYAHSQNLAVFANSWNPDDALGGTDCHLGRTAGDYYLLESFLVSAGNYRPLAEFQERGSKAYRYMLDRGVGIACLATLATGQLTATSNTTNQFRQAWFGAAMYGFDAFCFTDSLHSSSSATAYYYPNPVTSYGSSWLDFNWIRTTATGFERRTDTATLYISGDGRSTGTGGIR